MSVSTTVFPQCTPFYLATCPSAACHGVACMKPKDSGPWQPVCHSKDASAGQVMVSVRTYDIAVCLAATSAKPATLSLRFCQCHRHTAAPLQGSPVTAPAAARPPPPPPLCGRSCSSRGQSPLWTPPHTPTPQKTCETPQIWCRPLLCHAVGRCALEAVYNCTTARAPVSPCCWMSGEGTLGPHAADESHCFNFAAAAGAADVPANIWRRQRSASWWAVHLSVCLSAFCQCSAHPAAATCVMSLCIPLSLEVIFQRASNWPSCWLHRWPRPGPRLELFQGAADVCILRRGPRGPPWSRAGRPALPSLRPVQGMREICTHFRCSLANVGIHSCVDI